MNETKKSKIVRFLTDEVMSEAVKELLLKSFLKSQPTKEVNYLAASRIAIDLLEEAWKEMSKLKNQDSQATKGTPNVGL